MRLPRVRFTVRRMMVAVALVGVMCLGGREFWEMWLRRGHSFPAHPSQLSASVGDRNKLTWVAGQPLPVVVTYNFKFGTRKPAPGTTCVLLAEVWFEDVGTGLAVDCYTFDAPLTVGGREATSGSLTWDAMLPRPGRYYLRRSLSYWGPGGEMRTMSGGSGLYNIATTPPPGQPPDSSGANP